MKYLKNLGRRLVYNKALFAVFEFLALMIFHLADKFDRPFLWCLFLAIVKFELVMGFRSGQFSYLNGRESGKNSLNIIEQRVVAAAKHMKLATYGDRRGEGVLFATSFVARTGGHSRLLQTYLLHMEEAKLLISGDAAFFRRKKFLHDQGILISELFQGSKDRLNFNQESRLNPCSQVKLLLQKLNEIQPETVVLFNEPSDLSLLLAVLIYSQNIKTVRVFYYHHTDDFVPFLGNTFHGHIDLDSNQDIKCADMNNRSLIRISVRNRKVNNSAIVEPFTIFSFVPLTKIKSGSGYAKVISSLSKDGVKIILATRSGDTDGLIHLLECHHSDLSNIEVDDQCFDISKYAGLFHVYLDTFPIGGGMSIIDALSLGVPVVINAHEGYGVFRDLVLNEFMVENEDKVLGRINKLREDPLYYEASCSQAQQIFMKYFEESSMVDALRLQICSDSHPFEGLREDKVRTQ